MKKSELIFTAVRVPIDYLMFFISGMLAYLVRNSVVIQEIRPISFDLPFNKYLFLVSIASFFCVIIFAFLDLYGSEQRFNTKINDLSNTLTGMCVCAMFLLFLLFIRGEMFVSRFIVIATWMFAIFFVTLGRIFIRNLQNWLAIKYGIGVHKVLAIGVNGHGRAVIKEMQENKALGYKVIQVLKDFTIKDLEKTHEINNLDEIIQCDPELDKNKSLEIVEFCNQRRIAFRYIPNLFQTLATNANITTFSGVPVIEIRRTSLDGWGQIIKRVFDIFGSLILIVLFSPILIIAAIAIKLESKGPIFYLDYRYGKNFEKFIFYKFRSMYADLCSGEGPSATEKGNAMLKKLDHSELNTRKGAILKIKSDPRVTKVGKFIRKFSIDELPEFFNVLKGDISLVGPRPHMSYEVQKYETHHKKVFEIKPGVTGMAQVSGRSDLDFEEEIQLDAYYIENWSLWKDIQILLKTPFAVFKRRKVE
ncbi:MAG: sugar transferase [bacterium]